MVLMESGLIGESQLRRIKKMQTYGDNLEKLLERIKPYVQNQTKTTHGITIVLKKSAWSDHDKFREILDLAKEFHATPTVTPPGFILPLNGKPHINVVPPYLHPSDIEEGGPQPRTEINPSDPKIQTLFLSIKTEGQRDPIKVFPSPTTPGKYRIKDGHCRAMIIFNMLGRSEIWAVSDERTELEAYKDALILNNARNNLTAYDVGHYIKRVLMIKFPKIFPNQTAVASFLNISQEYTNQVISAYETVEAQRDKLPPETIARAMKMPERSLRSVRRVPEELQSTVLEKITEENMSTRQSEKLAQEVTTDEKTVEEKVRALRKEGEKIQRKYDRLLAKLLVECRAKLPEVFVRDLYGRVPDGKITVEKANAYAESWIGVAYVVLKGVGKLDFVFEESAKW